LNDGPNEATETRRLLLAVLSIVTGLIYPMVITGISQVVFFAPGHGSLISDGKVVGSELIGQQFDDPKYFWGRLSATSPAYNAGSSSGSNYGPLNPALKDAAKARIDALKKADPEAGANVPVDLVTASASGLDPHISPAAAEYQVRRIARARGLDEVRVRELVREHTEDRQWGVFGEPVVNVLALNLSLDAQSKQRIAQ
jgi:K+-transporting ATPase ATPase C chain